VNDFSKFREKFRVEELKLFETKHWVWSLRPVQVTLGSGVLSLKRPCSFFSQLEEAEFCDLQAIIEVIEQSLSRTFNYDVANYLMLMMVDKHVHFHVIPRYGRSIEMFDTVWHDRCWPGVPDLAVGIEEPLVLKKLCEFIKSNILS